MPDPNVALDVPLFVDVDVSTDDFPFVRCNYLAIERDEPDPNWILALNGLNIPFMLLHLAGIVKQPLHDAVRFFDAGIVDEFFSTLEKDDRMSVDVADVWIPNFLFRWSPKTGMVYRMRQRLFSLAFQYRHGFIDREVFESACKEDVEGLRFSEDESEAFRSWHERQMGMAREHFPKEERLMLRRREPEQ